MYVKVPTLILRFLEGGCWRLASLLGRLDLMLGRWVERVRAAQLWAIDKALVAFQATIPQDLSVPAVEPSPLDAPPIALPDAVPDVSPAPVSLAPTFPGVLH